MPNPVSLCVPETLQICQFHTCAAYNQYRPQTCGLKLPCNLRPFWLLLPHYFFNPLRVYQAFGLLFLLPIFFSSCYLAFYLWLEVHSRISTSLGFIVSKSLDRICIALSPLSIWRDPSHLTLLWSLESPTHWANLG